MRNLDEMNTYYFDYASTTPVDSLVVDKMKDCLSVDGAFGTKDIYECQKLCQNTYECNYFVFDTRLFSKKCWLKTGKSFILPPLFGVILGPKHCNDGYEAPKDSVNSYDAPPAPRDNYEEP